MSGLNLKPEKPEWMGRWNQDGHVISIYVENGEIVDRDIDHPLSCKLLRDDNDFHIRSYFYDCHLDEELSYVGFDLFDFDDVADLITMLPDGWHETEIRWYFDAWMTPSTPAGPAEGDSEFAWEPV